ncbi:Uncharacterised protein [uncultured archaeon]|nr:Uncharacterised protein [uncultured archaeon]
MKIGLYGAEGNWQQTILVDRTEIPGRDDYRYTIVNPVFNLEGEVDVELKDLLSFQDEGDPIADVFEGLVSSETQLIAEITRFYPNSYRDAKEMPKKFQNQGVGTSVLRTLMHDLFVTEEVNHFYVRNPKPPFHNLLIGRGYRLLQIKEEPQDNHLYRKIVKLSQI